MIDETADSVAAIAVAVAIDTTTTTTSTKGEDGVNDLQEGVTYVIGRSGGTHSGDTITGTGVRRATGQQRRDSTVGAKTGTRTGAGARQQWKKQTTPINHPFPITRQKRE